MTIRQMIEELLQFNMDAKVYFQTEKEQCDYFSFSWNDPNGDSGDHPYKTKCITNEVHLWLDDTCEREKGNGKDNG